MTDKKQPLILHTGSGLVQIGSTGGRIVAEMVGSALDLSRAAKKRTEAAQRFTIGDQLLCEPDYQQIMLWAAALNLQPETVLERLLIDPGEMGPQEYRTQITNGRFIKLCWDMSLLPLVYFEWVKGLMIEAITFYAPKEYEATERILSLSLPELRSLTCDKMGFSSIDLSAVPLLNSLSCASNKPTWRKALSQANIVFDSEMLQNACIFGGFYVEAGPRSFAFFAVQMLSGLGEAIRPHLKTIYRAIKNVPGFEIIAAEMDTDAEIGEAEWSGALTSLDLSAVPLLATLNCSANELTELDLSSVPLLSELDCRRTNIAELNICPLESLDYLLHDEDKINLIKRSDQTFRTCSKLRGSSSALQ